ncbi:MAG: PPOX class F420-dependent oxidoreductase [Pseudomonadota bacterium]
MKSKEISQMERGSYISFATRKRSGEFVATPVWFAPHEDSYFVFSAGAAGKVKRLRNFSECQIASCTVSGRVTGDWFDTHAYLLSEGVEEQQALAALRKKYGWQMFIGDVFGKLTGKMEERAYIRIDKPA